MPRGYLRNAEHVSRKQRHGSSSKTSCKGHRGRSKAARWEQCSHYDPDMTGLAWEARLDRPVALPRAPSPPIVPHVRAGSCAICLEDNTAVIDIARCGQGHLACLPCLRHYYLQRDISLYPLRCFGCERLVPPSKLQREAVITSDDALAMVRAFARLARRHRQGCRAGGHVEQRCYNCHTPLNVTRGGRSIPCPKCKLINTPRLGLVAHLTEVAEQLPRDIMGFNYGVALCPHCRVVISKGDGCAHMVCALCGHDFDWNRAPRLSHAERLTFEEMEARTLDRFQNVTVDTALPAAVAGVQRTGRSAAAAAAAGAEGAETVAETVAAAGVAAVAAAGAAAAATATAVTVKDTAAAAAQQQQASQPAAGARATATRKPTSSVPATTTTEAAAEAPASWAARVRAGSAAKGA